MHRTSGIAAATTDHVRGVVVVLVLIEEIGHGDEKLGNAVTSDICIMQ